MTWVACSTPTNGVGSAGGSTEAPPTEETTKPASPALNRIDRAAFNANASYLAMPYFWASDIENPGVLDPDELALLWRSDKDIPTTRPEPGWLTTDFVPAYEAILSGASVKASSEQTSEEDARRAMMHKELAQGRPTLILSDFRDAPAEDRAMVTHILKAAQQVEMLHMRQKGALKWSEKIPADDTKSRAVFERNQGPWCEAPATQADKNCNAVSTKPPFRVDVYPDGLQTDGAGFCEDLKKKVGPGFDDHFSVVRVGDNGEPKVVPYHQAYRDEMQAIAVTLDDAEKAVNAKEAALKTYLKAAAQAFRDGSWETADEAWVNMNAHNSNWYLRIGPDEVYWEPCAIRAGFHVSFGRVDKGSLAWQEKLEPHKRAMEETLASLAGPPYKARNVMFQLPDFMEVVVNAGDSRAPSGATIGQSLPNWGKMREQGRGRTVAMTNFYTDDDSKKALSEQAASLLCADTMATYSTDSLFGLIGTMLHEAAHNLGPAGEYKVRGKSDEQALGGPLASLYEEFKAQTAALFFTDYLQTKGILSDDEAKKAHTRDITWAFGHISRGMVDGDGNLRPYSQLAMIQIGFFMRSKALVYRTEEMAANGSDKGCFAVDWTQFPSSIKKLMREVAQIKATYDKKRAERLRKEYVEGQGEIAVARRVITERVLRTPKPSFVYSVRL